MHTVIRHSRCVQLYCSLLYSTVTLPKKGNVFLSRIGTQCFEQCMCIHGSDQFCRWNTRKNWYQKHVERLRGKRSHFPNHERNSKNYSSPSLISFISFFLSYHPREVTHAPCLFVNCKESRLSFASSTSYQHARTKETE
jgi:hypothetical protein